MTTLEQRAYDAMHEAFCRLRHFAALPLNESGRNYLFLIADAAHNIPDALSGKSAYHQETLERDVLALETLLAEPYSIASAKYLSQGELQAPVLKRLWNAIGLRP